MHGQDYRGNNADPTNPSFIGFLPQGVGTGYARGAAIGRTESEGFQRPFPSVPQNGGNQFAGAGYHNNIPKPRMGGLIGELPASGRTYQVPQQYGEQHQSQAIGYGEPQQLVARLRMGGDDSQLRSSGQLAFYRGNQAPSYGNGLSGQRSSHPSLEPRMSAPPASQTSLPPGFQRGPEAMPLQHRGSSIGQTGQPLAGRMNSGNNSAVSTYAGSYASQQLPSPFVPASTTQPIVGGAASQYSIPLAQGVEDSQRLASYATDGMSNMGSISNLGSVSQLGSTSQMGSIGTPSLHHSTSRSGGIALSGGLQRSTSSKVKAVCSSGGHFVKLDAGGLEYKGGETRLIQVPNFCSFAVLLESLERLAGRLANSNSGSSTLSPSLKYQLPSEPNVYVDLVDDEDTQLMFDDWNDYTQSKREGTSKLHLFVDWRKESSQSSGEAKQPDLGTIGSVESMDASTQRSSAERMDSAGANDNSADSARVRQSSSAEGATREQSTPAVIDYNSIAGRMEVIQPKDVSLVKYLGSGGYGEVYLGKWHSSEAAIKCLNPSLFFNAGQVSQAAITELIREADLLGSLRHPNVVWVYGVVLPSPTGDDSSDEDSDDSSADAARMPSSAAQQQGKGSVPGSVRPPAIVTEFMSQGSLKGALQRKADIVQGSLMRVLIAMDAAKGMDYLHQKNIVHFDLKSANLLLGWRDRRAVCKVADFGLSKQKRETYVSNVSSQRGTLPWIAPEIIKSPHAVTEKVDVFSFGVVLWELWTGKEPYDGLNYHALLHQITTSDTSLRPALPGSSDWDSAVGPEPVPGYRALMERCWTESPAGRPTFSQIIKALKDMATALRPKKPRPPGAAAGGASSSRSSRLASANLPSPSNTPSNPQAPDVTPAVPSQPPQPTTEDPKQLSQPKAQEPEDKRPAAEVPSPGARMQNPFAAQSQKPLDKPCPPDTDPSNPEPKPIGEALASAATPSTLSDPFKEPEGQNPAPAGQAGQPIGEALSLGTSIDTASQGTSVLASPHSESAGSTTPKHRPAVSAFGAVASQTEK